MYAREVTRESESQCERKQIKSQQEKYREIYTPTDLDISLRLQDPYLGEDAEEVLRQVADMSAPHLKRPRIPESAPAACVQLMRDCWDKKVRS